MLVLILSLLMWLMPQGDQPDYIIFIPDDCERWNLGYRTEELEAKGYPKGVRFISTKEFSGSIVFVSHFWVEEKNLEIKTLTYPEILRSEIIYTSDLEAVDWLKYWRKDTPKLFLLLPEDYCSEKRFNFNHTFTLYEVEIEIDGH